MHKIRKALAASAAAVLTLSSAAGMLSFSASAASKPTISMGVIAGDAKISANIIISDLSDDVKNYDITLDGNPVDVEKTDKGCQFTFESAAADMADPHQITVSHKTNDSDYNQTTICIDDYLIHVAEQYPAYTDLANAMRAYGHAAGELFGTTAAAINEVLTSTSITSLKSEIKKYSSDFSTDGYNAVLSGKSAPVSYEGMNLSLRSETVLSLFYLPTAASSMENAKEYLEGFTGAEVQKQKVGDTVYLTHSITVPAKELFDSFSLQNGTALATEDFGVQDYLKAAVSGSYDEKLQNACCALYNYAKVVSEFVPPSGETEGHEEGPFTGNATHYNKEEFGDQLNTHLDDYCSKNGIYYCALSPHDYDEYAGAMIEITYNGKTIKALAADLMSEGTGHDIDLQEEAFADLASLSTGTLSVSWKVVANDQVSKVNSGNIVYHLEGSNQYYAKIYVHNPLYPIKSFAYSTDGSSYTTVQKASDGGACYELKSIDASKKIWFQMTDIFDQTITEESFSLSLSGSDNQDKEVNGTVQFPK